MSKFVGVRVMIAGGEVVVEFVDDDCDTFRQFRLRNGWLLFETVARICLEAWAEENGLPGPKLFEESEPPN
jgi:hypothetical protein